MNRRQGASAIAAFDNIAELGSPAFACCMMPSHTALRTFFWHHCSTAGDSILRNGSTELRCSDLILRLNAERVSIMSGPGRGDAYYTELRRREKEEWHQLLFVLVSFAIVLVIFVLIDQWHTENTPPKHPVFDDWLAPRTSPISNVRAPSHSFTRTPTHTHTHTYYNHAHTETHNMMIAEAV